MEEKDQTTREVQTTSGQVGNTTVERQTVSEARSTSGRTVATQVVWYITGLIAILLALRVVLQLLGANQDNGFVSFIYSISGFFAAPFFGMFSYHPSYGVSYFEVSSVVAILIYLLIGWGIAKLFTIGQTR